MEPSRPNGDSSPVGQRESTHVGNRQRVKLKSICLKLFLQWLWGYGAERRSWIQVALIRRRGTGGKRKKVAVPGG